MHKCRVDMESKSDRISVVTAGNERATLTPILNVKAFHKYIPGWSRL